MKTSTSLRITLFALASLGLLQPGVAAAPAATLAHDGQHDFDFNIGTWKTEIRRLVNPLSGSRTWVTYSGTHTVRKVWDGRADLGELEITGTSGSVRGQHIEDTALRLYNPEARQWNVYLASSKSGTLGAPMVGEFKDGIGVFINQDSYDGRTVLVRDVWSKITATSCHNEWAYSEDGGKTWEVNWIADDTRID